MSQEFQEPEEERGEYPMFARQTSELERNEWLIGGLITLVGAGIGFVYALNKNRSRKKSGLSTLESDALAAFEGAVIGAIIAAFAVILYRVYYHQKYVRSLSRIEEARQTGRLQQTRSRYGLVSTTGKPEGMRTVASQAA
jgi:hypothetical protein